MALLSYFVISLENEQLFTKNTKILKIVMFSLIHNERLDRNPTVQLMTSSLLPGGGALGLFGWGCAAGTLERLSL